MGSDGFAVAATACPAAAEAFAKYCGIVSGCTNAKTRQGLVELSQAIGGIEGLWDAIFADIPKLMPFIDLEDVSLFNFFYDFAFFICRENGQKSITIQRAVAAWRIVLNGRFRLLDRWCNFVEKYQRHNISEDTWQQLLAFSRCVNEDLEGYDPRGAWPVLIDDFVEQMHRIYHYSDCSSPMESQCSISSTFRGLDLLPGSKRKCRTHFNPNEDVELSDSFTRSVHLTPLKRLKESSGTRYGVWESHQGTPFSNSSSYYCEDTNLQNSRGCLQNSPCIGEDTLSKGFEGCISMKCSF
ncbi:defective in cullin neddylation protein AAR3-like isoform X1 [Phragmites australis]|uniref:defective in cullin neddylation protein AAR3-like isoform X1 n=1 Tax=Phragmites australis TaxID=29695 RepID=UPI002D76DF66|nr:defective in cullin neddylation protein AAR3-like isoform X1 [Phragmites australis]